MERINDEDWNSTQKLNRHTFVLLAVAILQVGKSAAKFTVIFGTFSVRTTVGNRKDTFLYTLD
jgi:hypothetical protein